MSFKLCLSWALAATDSSAYRAVKLQNKTTLSGVAEVVPSWNEV